MPDTVKLYRCACAPARDNSVAGLYSLVATCEANGVNPLDYLVDVMLRIQDHPAVAIGDLLPHRSKPRAA